MKKLIAATMACAILAGCATRADNIAPAYVSTLGYQGLSCKQLAIEATDISSRAAAAAGMQDQKATGDAVAMTAAVIVFWPALFFVRGDGAQAAEVSRLKGEMQAIETTSRRRGCGITFETQRPKKTAAKSKPTSGY
jgi:hypothetical protein